MTWPACVARLADDQRCVLLANWTFLCGAAAASGFMSYYKLFYLIVGPSRAKVDDRVHSFYWVQPASVPRRKNKRCLHITFIFDECYGSG